MKNLQLDYTNKYEVINYINTTICDMISEDLKNYNCDHEDALDHEGALFEIINGLSDVIYNYQAQKVSEAFGLSPFDYSDWTGERFNSYNQMAFEVIYNAYNENN